MSARRRVRLDKLLLDRGLVGSRNRGQRLIMAGEVLVDGHRAVKPSDLVYADAAIEIVTPLPYVSRGGLKLAAALEAFQVEVDESVCADVGACTGGFTDVLLQHGAKRVYAIDVGYGQFPELRPGANGKSQGTVVDVLVGWIGDVPVAGSGGAVDDLLIPPVARDTQ